MEFYETEDRLGFRNIPPLVVELLRQIPRWVEEDNEAAEERLFPAPSGDPDEETLRDDWKAHVHPELHGLFQSARDTVAGDLRRLRENGEDFEIEFPRAHTEAWVSAVNQARIALAARHDFTEHEISQPEPLEINSERDFALFQMWVYDEILWRLVHLLE